jgi:hypothetical protein
MVMLSETCITEEIEDHEITFPGYKTIRCDSFSRHTGGVISIVRDDVSFSVISKDILDEKNTWMLTIKINKCPKKGVHSVLYHSPNQSHKKFLEFFAESCKKLTEGNNLVYIYGDFNIDMKTKNTYSNKLLNIIHENGLNQLVNENTRINKNSESIIDLIVTNDIYLPVEVSDNFKISDHETIKILFSTNTQNDIIKPTYTKNYRNTKNYSSQKLCEELLKQDWNTFEDDININANKFTKQMSEVVNNLMPRTEFILRNTCKWYTSEGTEKY